MKITYEKTLQLHQTDADTKTLEPISFPISWEATDGKRDFTKKHKK